MEYFLSVVRDNYANFEGRARRAEYWNFALFSMLISIGLVLVENLVGLTLGDAGMLSSLYSLAVFVPSLAVAIRRLHDTNRSGWWLLIAIIPIIGFIVLLVFLVQDSDAGSNQYGYNPKAPHTADIEDHLVD